MELDVFLDQIEQRANAATPGPWITIPYSNSRNLSVCSVGKGIANICDININRTEGTENTTFIAAARSDLPSLVKALRRAAGELQNIVDADFKGMREDFGLDANRQFRLWAQNRAKNTLAQLLREPAESVGRATDEQSAAPVTSNSISSASPASTQGATEKALGEKKPHL